MKFGKLETSFDNSNDLLKFLNSYCLIIICSICFCDGYCELFCMYNHV